MLLSEIFDQLIQGDLRDHFIANTEGDRLLPHHYPKLIPHVNLGILELYKRFDLHRQFLYIELNANIRTYYLQPKYARSSGSDVPIKYILDSACVPFTGNVLRINHVYKSCAEVTELRVNDRNADILEEYETCTPYYNSLHVHTPVTGQQLKVDYSSAPPSISSIDAEPSKIDVMLPYQFLEPLLLFIGAKYTSSLPASEGFKEGNNFMSLFEQSCRKLEELGLTIQDNTTDLRLCDNGWV